MSTFIPDYLATTPHICLTPANQTPQKTLIVKQTPKRVHATIRCLLAPENDKWNEIECLVIELGLPDKDGEVIWKNTGAFQISPTRFSKANVPGIWEMESAEMTLQYSWFAHPIEPVHILLRKELVLADGTVNAGKEIEIFEKYTDEHILINVACV